MRIVAQKTAEFGSNIEDIWRLLTDNTDYAWRSDVQEITVQESGSHFTEISREGIATEFTVAMRIPHQRYVLDLQNKNFTGRFTAVLEKNNGRTRIDLTEDLELTGKSRVKAFFARKYLDKQQKCYIEDIKKALGE